MISIINSGQKQLNSKQTSLTSVCLAESLTELGTDQPKLVVNKLSNFHFSDADKVIPTSVAKYSRWGTNHAHLCMAISLVSQKFKLFLWF